MAQSSQSAQAEKSIAQNKAKKRHTGTVFNTRFAAHKDELERLFMSLYNNHAAFDSLVDSMAEAYADRPADLKRLDKSREQDPDWYKRGNMFGMTMYTDLFAGDLKKLADKIRTSRSRSSPTCTSCRCSTCPTRTMTVAMRSRASTL